ncbi:hypothetical protein BC941DRAFT_465701 [Chlamydoabsidia padenii]|nr:hypothetical protein BC941DRAFT_465701 [Chlamydoabsidia padenii]
MSLLEKLLTCSMNCSTNDNDNDNLGIDQQYRHLLHTFYHQSPWIKKQNYGMERFNARAYASAAKALIRNLEDLKLKPRQVKPVVLYWNAGQGHGSRIKGYQHQSTSKLQ